MNLDYSLILFCLTLATGTIWLADAALSRRARSSGTGRSHDPQAPQPRTDVATARVRRTRARPGWVEIAIGFFPVLLVVFLVRSFVIEPFRIPSESMLPTLDVGDFIVVNKFAYGLRLPIVDREIVPVGEPRRGDIVVFRYPLDPSQDYVKRVVGLPGDTIVYRDKQLVIDGRVVPLTGAASPFDTPAFDTRPRRLRETLPRSGGSIAHDVLLDPQRAGGNRPMTRFPFFDHCRYGTGTTGGSATVTCTVPQGHYFVMGDNRDDSADSRYWGFVPEQNLIGRVMSIWMNFSHPGRIGAVH